MFINRLLRQSINTAIQETDQDYEVEHPDYEILKKAVEAIQMMIFGLWSLGTQDKPIVN